MLQINVLVYLYLCTHICPVATATTITILRIASSAICYCIVMSVQMYSSHSRLYSACMIADLLTGITDLGSTSLVFNTICLRSCWNLRSSRFLILPSVSSSEHQRKPILLKRSIPKMKCVWETRNIENKSVYHFPPYWGAIGPDWMVIEVM